MKLVDNILKRLGYINIKGETSNGTWTPLSLTGTFTNTSGEKVNNQTALTVSSLFACIRNVSEDIGKVPLKVFKREGKFRYEQSDHPLTRLLHFQPNPEMTASSFRETLNAHAMGWGNAYAEIERDVFGNPLYLWPLRTDRVTMYREKGTDKIFYRVRTKSGSHSDIWAKDMLHIHGLGSDGITGYNIVQYAVQSIGATIGMDKFAGSYFANGMNQSGTLTHPKHLSKEAQDRLRKQMEDKYTGASKAHRLLIIEEGMEFSNNTIDPKASQMIETRQFSVAEFCRWLRVPPHKVADLTRSTYSNIEEQNIDYVQDCLLGWFTRWEQFLWIKLLNDNEKSSGYYFKHAVEGLLRGNIKARYIAYVQMLNRGVFSINEVRGKEDMNPVPGGDKRFVPVNSMPLEDAGQQNNNNNNTDAIINDMAQRLASAEIKEIEKHIVHAETDPDKFRDWLSNFYVKHYEYISKTIKPLFEGKNKSVNLDCLSMKPFFFMVDGNSSVPSVVFNGCRQHHSKYIASNLRNYYED